MTLPGFRFIERRIAGALRVWIIAGVLLRVTRLRDGFDLFALVFYTTPWPVLAAGFAVLATRARLLGQGHPFRRYVLFTGGALFTWVATSWYSAPPPTRAADLRVVQWNVSRPVALLPRAAAWMRAQDADLLCISEAEPYFQGVMKEWQDGLPGYTLRLGPGGLLLAVRGEVLESSHGTLAPGSIYARYRLRVRGRTVNLLQIDLDARPGRSRRAAVARLQELAAAEAGGNLIIAGDFNLPRESALLDPLRRDFQQTFEAAGHGMAETWPAPLLALSLDQIWGGAAWQPLTARHGWSWYSDHRSVVVDLARL